MGLDGNLKWKFSTQTEQRLSDHWRTRASLTPPSQDVLSLRSQAGAGLQHARPWTLLTSGPGTSSPQGRRPPHGLILGLRMHPLSGLGFGHSCPQPSP